jgi:hypothetical protein
MYVGNYTTDNGSVVFLILHVMDVAIDRFLVMSVW